MSASLAARRRALVGRSGALRRELGEHAADLDARLAPAALALALLRSRAAKAALAALLFSGRGQRFGATFRRALALLGILDTLTALVGRRPAR